MAKLPRYVQQRVSPSGDISFRFNPPAPLVNADVVKRIELSSDEKEMRKQARQFNRMIDDYRATLPKVRRLYKNSTVADLV